MGRSRARVGRIIRGRFGVGIALMGCDAPALLFLLGFPSGFPRARE